jgi:hypothetical protein
MFGTKFAGKCIIVQFLGVEKDEKGLNAEFAEARREDLRREHAPPEVRRVFNLEAKFG